MFEMLESLVHAAIAPLAKERPFVVALQQAPQHKLPGGIAIPCGKIAKDIDRPLSTVVEAVVAGLHHSAIRSISASGPFVNVAFTRTAMFAGAMSAAHQAQRLVRTHTPERVMVEYLSPNTNKPLHLGHVRNGALGMAVANLLTARGHTIIRANLLNDRGAAICKSMLGYELFAKGQTPQSADQKGDHFVGGLYVRFAQAEKADESLGQRVQDMLQLWEDDDQYTRGLWIQMNEWVLEGFAKTSQSYGFRHDVEYRESDLYMLGKDIVQRGLEEGTFTQTQDGAVFYTLDVGMFGTSPDKKPRQVPILRGNGTSLYITQDLGTAVLKAGQYTLDRSIYVVADEQREHFRQLFAMLGSLGYPWVGKCFHLSYGMMELPEGKMKSREGTVIDADDLLEEMTALASEIVRTKRPKLEEYEIQRRAVRIALAAIKFYLLQFPVTSKIRFNPQQSLSFEGDTGPYCLYAYARLNSILRRGNLTGHEGLKNLPYVSLGNPQEEALALAISEMPRIIRQAAETYNPSLLAQKLLQLAKASNHFYHECPVFSEDKGLTDERLELCSATATMLRWGLSLLGIDVLDEM